MPRWPLVLLALVACHKSPPPLPDASAPVVVDAAPPPPIAPKLHPVITGDCPDLHVDLVGGTPVVSGGREAWTLDASPRRLYRMTDPAYDRLEGHDLGRYDAVMRAGGKDLGHAWLELDLENSTVKPRGNQLVLASAPATGFRTPQGARGFYAIKNVIEQPDGEVWTFGEHSTYLDIPGDERTPAARSHDRWFAWTADGAPVERELPGPEVGRGRRLPSGEIVADGTRAGDDLILRRWSPTGKLADLVAPMKAEAQATLHVGRSRVVLRSVYDDTYVDYRDGKLVPGTMKPPKAIDWMVTADDELWVATLDHVLWIQTNDGTITQETLPAEGRPTNEGATPWFYGHRGGLWVRTGTTWTPVEIGGLVEWVRTVGDETFVSLDRSSRWGNNVKRPTIDRALFSTKEHARLRCADRWEQKRATFLPDVPRWP